VVLSVSIALVFIVLPLDRVAVVTIHHLGWEKQQVKSSTVSLRELSFQRNTLICGAVPFLLCPAETSVLSERSSGRGIVPASRN
jgi:hypothetical protein